MVLHKLTAEALESVEGTMAAAFELKLTTASLCIKA
jgi:hypothetical protein